MPFHLALIIRYSLDNGSVKIRRRKRTIGNGPSNRPVFNHLDRLFHESDFILGQGFVEAD